MAQGKTDPKLGKMLREFFQATGLETIQRPQDKAEAYEGLRDGVRQFLHSMGLNIEDPSLKDTPMRVADMYTEELCYGLNYDNFPKCTTTPNKPPVNEMVMVDSIQTVSLCEHHFQTIAGLTHIAYIPADSLLGLSKFARVTNFFARRPQVQERMTEQIYEALRQILCTDDVAIQQVCIHHCMRSRGAMDPHSTTTTNKMGGRFLTVPALRQEFLSAIPRR